MRRLGVVDPKDFENDSIEEMELVEKMKNNARGIVYTYGYISYNYLKDILPKSTVTDLAGQVEAKILTGISPCPYPHKKRYCSADKCILVAF